MSATRAIDRSDGRGDSSTGQSLAVDKPSSQSTSTTLIGMLSTTGRRSTRVRLSARTASFAAVSGPRTRSAITPAVAASPPWSILKFDQSASAGVSAASTSSGVRLLAASVNAVSVFVKPGPWWTLTTPIFPQDRA
jgi:hypothetical protein